MQQTKYFCDICKTEHEYVELITLSVSINLVTSEKWKSYRSKYEKFPAPIEHVCHSCCIKAGIIVKRQHENEQLEPEPEPIENFIEWLIEEVTERVQDSIVEN